MKKILFIGSLPLITFFSYDKYQRYSQLSSNLNLNQTQINQLTALKKTSGNSILPNSEFNESNREKIIVIGGGIIGITTAYYLLKTDKYDVLMIEKNSQVGKETSYGNGCTMVPSKSQPWISPNFSKDIWNSLTNKEHPLKFHAGLFLDKFWFVWSINAFLSTFSNRYNSTLEKNLKLAHLSRLEFQKILEEFPASSINHTEKSQLIIYNKKKVNKEGLLKEIDHYKEIIPLQVQVFESEKELKNFDPFFSTVKLENTLSVASEDEYNFFVKKFNDNAINQMKKNPHFKVITECVAQEWVLNENKQVIGINTNKGIVMADKFIASTAYWTKELIAKLGFKIPILAAKGHSMTFSTPKNIPQQKACIFYIENGIMHTNLGNVIRIAGLVDYMGETMKILPNRKEQLIKSAELFYGYDRKDRAEFWTGLRPVTSDDCPIIGQLDSKFPNVFVNAGHGSKGITWSFGSGKLMASIISGEEISIVNKDDYLLERFWLV